MSPTRAVALLVLLLGGCRCPSSQTTTPPLEPVRVAASLVFPDTFVGFSTQRALTLTNPGRSARQVRLSTSLPFSTSAEVSLGGGESSDVFVGFAPLEPGDIVGALELVDAEAHVTTSVELTARALPVPACAAPEPCHTRRFEVSQGQCVDEPALDGSSCASPLACFASATCVGGACLGARVTCDDGRRCTLDVCSPSGCGQVDGTPFCPATSNPCLAPTCDETSGCGVTPVPDGTACGRRTCTTALVCIDGACVTRTPPMNQTCADVLVGVPAGTGWSDGRGAEARFESPFAIAAVGDVAYVSEKDVIRRVTLAGDVTTVAGRRLGTRGFGVADGVGARALLGRTPGVAAAGAPGQVLFVDQNALRLLTQGGLVTTLVPFRAGASGIGDGVGVTASLVGDRLVSTASGVSFASVVGSCTLAGCDGFDGGLILSRDATAQGVLSTKARRSVESLPGFTAVDVSWLQVSAPAPGVVCVTVSSFSQGVRTWRLTRLVDGGLGDDGSSCALREFPESPERLQVRRSGISGVDAQGTTWALLGGRGRIVDGPLASADLSQVRDADRDADGGLWFIDETAVRYLHSGVVTTIAGPLPDRRLVDGPSGRLRGQQGLVLTPAALFFADGLERVIRRAALSDFSLQSFGVRPAPSDARDGPVGVASFRVPRPAVFHLGTLLVQDETGLGVRTLRAMNVTTYEVATQLLVPPSVFGPFRSSGGALWGRASGAGLRRLWLDGGVEPVVAPTLEVVDFDVAGPNRFVAAVMDQSGLATFATQLVQVDGAGQVLPLAGRPESEGRDFLGGPVATARLGAIKHVRVAPDGTVYWSQYDENAIDALSSSGQVRRVIELADQPLDFVVASDGTLLVAVDAALLRVRP